MTQSNIKKAKYFFVAFFCILHSVLRLALTLATKKINNVETSNESTSDRKVSNKTIGFNRH